MVISKATNILVAGVGGQGNRTLMKIIALAALEDSREVRVRSSTSLGQLGGSITCHIRLGPSASASIPAGEVDILLALEMNEALRAIPMMRREALAFIHTYRRVPIAAGIRGANYPSMQEIEKAGTDKAIKCIFVPENLLSYGSAVQGRCFTGLVNMVMLGTFCSYTQALPRCLVEQALSQCLPPASALQNLHAFAIGWQHGEREATR